MNYVTINTNIMNTCKVCVKQERPLHGACLAFKGGVYWLCNECADKIEKMLIGEE